MARILLVESDTALRAMMCCALEEAKHQVVVAKDAADGCAALAAGGPFDFVLADLMTPDLDGIELALEISRAHPGTRILLMATHGPNGNE